MKTTKYRPCDTVWIVVSTNGDRVTLAFKGVIVRRCPEHIGAYEVAAEDEAMCFYPGHMVPRDVNRMGRDKPRRAKDGLPADIFPNRRGA